MVDYHRKIKCVRLPSEPGNESCICIYIYFFFFSFFYEPWDKGRSLNSRAERKGGQKRVRMHTLLRYSILEILSRINTTRACKRIMLVAAGRFFLASSVLRRCIFLPFIPMLHRLLPPPLSLLYRCRRNFLRLPFHGFLFPCVALTAITREGKHDADLSAGLSGDARNLLRLNCI